MVNIEKLYHIISEEISTMRTICDRNQVELADDSGLRISIESRSPIDASVCVKKKCSFSGFFGVETSFIWHLKDKEDTDLLVGRLKKIQSTIVKDGPYGFSRRSTYIKRRNKVSFAMSGNFVSQASVKRIVIIGEGGLILDDVSIPDRKPWFLIETSKSQISSNMFDGDPKQLSVLYDLDGWWPIDFSSNNNWSSSKRVKVRATSVLSSTDGKLLTMHDKFVIDLAVKLFNENRKE